MGHLAIKRSEEKTDSYGKGGEFNLNQFFTGDVGLFAGIKARTPIKDLILKAEISSDNYIRDDNLLEELPSSNTNFGARYYINDSLTISSHYMHGNEIGLQVSFLQILIRLMVVILLNLYHNHFILHHMILIRMMKVIGMT